MRRARLPPSRLCNLALVIHLPRPSASSVLRARAPARQQVSSLEESVRSRLPIQAVCIPPCPRLPSLVVAVLAPLLRPFLPPPPSRYHFSSTTMFTCITTPSHETLPIATN